MKSKEEIKTWLLENATNEAGNVDISGIDFGDKEVILEEIKAKRIFNNKQKAKEDIYSGHQEAGKMIYNEHQEAYHIFNRVQKAECIDNEHQKAKERITNKGQEAGIIVSSNQKADSWIF